MDVNEYIGFTYVTAPIFEIMSKINTKVSVSCNVARNSVVVCYRRFEETRCFHLQSNFKDSTFILNAGDNLHGSAIKETIYFRVLGDLL
jgi:hypothetical protein